MAVTTLQDAIPPFYDAAGAAQNTFTTIRDIGPSTATNNGQNPIIPIITEKGKRFRVSAFGVVGATTGTNNLTLSLCYGTTATVLAATAATTVTASATNVPWRLEADIVFYTFGTGGTVITQGKVFIGTSVSAYASPAPIPATALATVSVDTTTAKALILAGTWSASNAANTITCWDLRLERLN